jgi:hypothetical protein
MLKAGFSRHLLPALMVRETFEFLTVGEDVLQSPCVLSSLDPLSDSRGVALMNSEGNTINESPRIEIKYETIGSESIILEIAIP